MSSRVMILAGDVAGYERLSEGGAGARDQNAERLSIVELVRTIDQFLIWINERIASVRLTERYGIGVRIDEATRAPRWIGGVQESPRSRTLDCGTAFGALIILLNVQNAETLGI